MEFIDLLESVLDPPHNDLSPFVFSDKRLIDQVRFKILDVWSQVNKISPATRLLIVGSIATYNYTNDSDVDVTIVMPDESKLDEAQNIAKYNNGREYAGPHEINYYVRPEYDTTFFDSIYDILNDSWLKGPSDVSVNVESYMGYFDNIVTTIDAQRAKLISDLAQFQQLKYLDNAGKSMARNKIGEVLDDLENDIDSIKGSYHWIRRTRNLAFAERDLDRIAEYGSRNALPENVVYLLLRRYCYLNLLHVLADIDEPIEINDVDEIESAMNKFDSCHSRQRIVHSVDPSNEP